VEELTADFNSQLSFREKKKKIKRDEMRVERIVNKLISEKFCSQAAIKKKARRKDY
jgi:hypothetical protein